ncbi:MAG: aldehyde dehydrogenase EutE [Bacteroidetes bacterium CG_4_10_14_3_um_filter_31_20]|nr:aldehyde dehydrogenase EutE [Bacteroidota bacterium]PIY04850.1 MAG: aldehyde dehydrogenase EutE [Bacteroidetes bacterium CG_4_10_14_3_um_filter_31_20]
MDNLEQNVRKLVEEVVKSMNLTSTNVNNEKKLGVFSNLNNAVDASDVAFKEFSKISLETRKKIITNIRKISMEYNEILSKMAHEETGMGRWEDKVLKNELGINKTPGIEDIVPETFTDDHGLTLVERAPYGVIGAITPSTNPVVTIISNAIGMIAAGNTVVFNPHPSAKKVSASLISLLNTAIIEAGGPLNLISCIDEPTIESAKELMTHKKIAILVVTGGPAVVKTAMNSGKKVIAAGPGNPPVVVDETAIITKAAKDIVDGASFDNNVICICEKEVIVVESVATQLIEEMKKNGCFELTGNQIKQITELVISEPGKPGHEGAANKKFVGKNADFIAKGIGLTVPLSTRLLICEVDKNHPLVWTEQLMPVMPIVRVKDVDTAIDLAVECEHGFRHTAMMYSLNIAKLSKMARIMNCSIFIKNGPSYAGLGYGGAGFASFTIASPTGDGVTRARTFTRERRCTLVDYLRII